MKKRKILFHSNASWLKTGFGRFSRQLLKYLYQTNRFEIIHLCGGIVQGDPMLERTPWRSIGALPSNQQELEQLKRDPGVWQHAVYGDYILDKIIEEYKPQIYYGAEDIWMLSNFDRKWWGSINSILHTTLDSLPLLPTAIDNANKIKNFWVWASFAEREMHKLGFSHIKTVPGGIEVEHFHKLSASQRLQLFQNANIDPNVFVIGAVFRNQLRKTVDRTLEGYAMFKKQNPSIQTCCLFHTCFSEQTGWNIMRLADEFGIPHNEIYTSYICKECKNYHVAPFTGEEKNCPHCKTEKACRTTGPALGVSEEQLNEIYNLMSVLVNSTTSGGYEYACFEAKLVELPVLVPGYSYGEDLITPESGGLPLEFSTYKEIQTGFTKSSVYYSSIAKRLNQVFHLNPSKRDEMGKKARQWVIDNHSMEVVGKKIFDMIDAMPDHNYDFKIDYVAKNPEFQMPQIDDNVEWLKVMYKEILHMDNPGDGLDYWLKTLKDGGNRVDIEKFFRETARNENQKNLKVDFASTLEGKAEDRILFCMPKSLGDNFLCTSLFKSIKELYPDKLLYVACENQYANVYEGNQNVYKVIDWQPFMDNILTLEGIGNVPKVFEVVYVPHFATQRLISYTHGSSRDKSNVELVCT